MRHLLLFICCVATLLSYSQERAVIDKIVAMVGDEVILLSDVEEQFAYDSERAGNLPESAKCGILENLMVQKLLVNQAKLDSIIVEDDVVEQQLDSRVDYILGLMNNDVSQFEEYYGKSIAQVRAEMREDLRAQVTAQRMQENVIQNIRITPSEVKAYFDKIPQDSLPYFNSEVEMSEIVLKPEVSKVEREKAITKLEELRQRILDGEEFAQLATTFSDDPGSARSGGDLGLQKRGTFVPEFEAAAYNLEEGELSEVIESEFGFHLIELLKRRGNLVHTRHILIKPVITEADLEATERKLDSIRQAFLVDTLTFEAYVKLHSDDKQQSYNNGGRMINPASGNTFFETAEIENPDIFFAIDTIEVGEITQPIEFTTPTGEIAYRIVLLLSRTDPHQANLKQDYTKVKQAAIEGRKAEFFQKWLQEKMKSTYVNVEEKMLDQCEILREWSQVMQNQAKKSQATRSRTD